MGNNPLGFIDPFGLDRRPLPDIFKSLQEQGIIEKHRNWESFTKYLIINQGRDGLHPDTAMKNMPQAPLVPDSYLVTDSIKLQMREVHLAKCVWAVINRWIDNQYDKRKAEDLASLEVMNRAGGFIYGLRPESAYYLIESIHDPEMKRKAIKAMEKNTSIRRTVKHKTGMGTQAGTIYLLYTDSNNHYDGKEWPASWNWAGVE